MKLFQIVKNALRLLILFITKKFTSRRCRKTSWSGRAQSQRN